METKLDFLHTNENINNHIGVDDFEIILTKNKYAHERTSQIINVIEKICS